jgi:hypothetical protein
MVHGAVLVAVPLIIWAENWPHFRGPNGQRISTETGLPVEWSETRTIAWKSPVPGAGWVVFSDRLG